MKESILRPGLLVSLKSTLRGGVTYERRDLPTEPTEEVPPNEGVEQKDVARWETTRIIEDPAEHALATQVRSKAAAEIRKVCSTTSFGLLCPASYEAELDAAVQRARRMVAEFNKTASFTVVEVFVLKGRIASTDTEAARAIGREVADLIASMNKAIDDLDPSAIREAATRAREMSAMLSPELSQTVGEAVEAARKAARSIVKRVEKNGEAAAIVLADIQRGSIEKARIAFLDLDNDGLPEVETPELPAVNLQRLAIAVGEVDADVVAEVA